MKSIFQVSASERKNQELEPERRNQAVNQFLDQGALWIKGLFDPEIIRQLQLAYHQRYTSKSKSELRRKGAVVGENRFMITVKIKKPFNDPLVFANPLLLPVLHSLLGHDCLISSFGSVVALPGADAQDIHFDHPPLFGKEELCASLPPYAVTVVIPLIDLTEQTGTTAIWEGTHNRMGAWDEVSNLMESPNWDRASLPTPKVGDAYMMDYRVIHGGTANVSETARPILYLVFSRRWFSDGYNFLDQSPVDISKKQLKRLSAHHRSLFDGAAS